MSQDLIDHLVDGESDDNNNIDSDDDPIYFNIENDEFMKWSMMKTMTVTMMMKIQTNNKCELETITALCVALPWLWIT